MKLLGAFALGASVVAAASSALSAPAAVPAACDRANHGATDFNEDKRQCYGTLYGQGRYTEVIDRIRLVAIGTSPQDLYFSGASYLGLSTREASDGVKCVYAGRARENLTRFLREAQKQYTTSGTFGSAEDMAYVDAATKMLDAAKSIRGCEDSSYTPDELTDYALRYGRDRARRMMFDTGPNDPVAAGARDAMQQINSNMRDIVSSAVQLESRVTLYDVEIKSDIASLDASAARVSGAFGKPNNVPQLVTIRDNWTGTGLAPFEYDANGLVTVLAAMDSSTRYIDDASSAIRAQRGSILALMGVGDYGSYFALKAKTVGQLSTASTELLAAVNTWTILRGTQGWSRVDVADSTAPGSVLAAAQAATTGVWTSRTSKAQAWCKKSKPQWYCAKGTP